MLRLVTDGPGWTDDTVFFKWVSEGNSEPLLIGVNSGSGMPVIFTEQSFDDAVAALTTLGDWRNEDDGTNNYVEGDSPDLFDINDWDEDEDEFFEFAEEFDNVSDYLKELGYDSGDDLYFRDDAEEYLRDHGIKCNSEEDEAYQLLDDAGYYHEEYADYMYTQEALDNIINQLKK